MTGALIGYAANHMMDRATSWYFRVQTEASREREEEIAPGGTLIAMGHDIGGTFGKDLDDVQAEQVGVLAHRMLGATYGVIAATLVRLGVRPMVAGPAVGAAAWVLVDEGTALPTLTRYLPESHIRGIIGHGTWGLTAGVLLWLVTDPTDPETTAGTWT